jgi:hypothetical protein
MPGEVIYLSSTAKMLRSRGSRHKSHVAMFQDFNGETRAPQDLDRDFTRRLGWRWSFPLNTPLRE